MDEGVTEERGALKENEGVNKEIGASYEERASEEENEGARRKARSDK